MYTIIEIDLLAMVKESTTSGRVIGALNSTFIYLFPKKSKPISFNEYMPISLCNLVYKVIFKIIATRIKDYLSKFVSKEQFGFFI